MKHFPYYSDFNTPLPDLQYTISQTELDLYNCNQASETRKLKDTQANLERAETNLKEADR